MKQAFFAGCIAVMLLLSLTTAFLQPVVHAGDSNAQKAVETSEDPKDVFTAVSQQTSGTEKISYDNAHAVTLMLDGTATELTLSNYLVGVVLAEMPASFEPAALEAQAVAARTFALKQIQNPKHDDADLCADGTCCQQYLSPTRAQDKLGKNFQQYKDKISDAVHRTDGEVITYEGNLIDAVYFSCSGGATEDAAAVWGGDIPYLQSVESPGEEKSTRYLDEKEVPIEEFRQTLMQSEPNVALKDAPLNWFGSITHSDGGGVESIQIGGVTFSGTKIRQLFQLRSTWFEISLSDDAVTFKTRGYGHRVGMSQYGAQAMALEGAGYQEILKHYYSGVEVTRWNDQGLDTAPMIG